MEKYKLKYYFNAEVKSKKTREITEYIIAHIYPCNIQSIVIITSIDCNVAHH